MHNIRFSIPFPRKFRSPALLRRGARECFPEEELRQSLHGGFRRKAVSPEPSRTVPCRGVVKGLTEELLFSAQKKKNLFFFLFPLDKTARIGYN